MSKPKLGSGERFKELENKIEHSKNPPDNPAAVAAAIGRKKYGKEAFQRLALKAREKKAK